MSVNNTNPATLFGGTWEKMSGGFLYGAVNSVGNGNGTGTATAGNNGNTGSTTLTVDQIPSHKHSINVPFYNYQASGYGLNGQVYKTSSQLQNGSWATDNIGGGKGHTHTLNNHTHNIPYMAVWVWKRVK